MKVNAVDPNQRKDSHWMGCWSDSSCGDVTNKKNEKCDTRNGRGWVFEGGGNYECRGRCGSDYWVKCKRNYEQSGWDTIPDNVVRLYSGLEGTKRYNKPHFRDFPIGSHGDMGDLNDSTSSIAVPLGLKATVYENTNYAGAIAEIRGDAPSDYSAGVGGTLRNLFHYDMESKISSLKVERDCEYESNYLMSDCDVASNVPGSSTFNKRKTYCNASVDNAYSNTCVNWCKSNFTECTLLSLKNDCVKYNYCMDDDPKKCSDKCTSQAIAALKARCNKHGLDTDQGMRLYGCNEKAIDIFLDECKEYKVNEAVCTAIELQNAKTNDFNKQQLDIASTAQTQSQQNYNDTLNTINTVLGLTPADSGTSSDSNDKSDPLASITDFLAENSLVVGGVVTGVSLLSFFASFGLLLLK